MNIALQGEVVGEGIQGNKYCIKGHEIYFFNAFDIDKQSYYSFEDFSVLMAKLQLQTVPFEGFVRLVTDIPALVQLSIAKSQLNDKVQREGIVIRPVNEIVDDKFGRVSFKVINPEFLLKYDE